MTNHELIKKIYLRISRFKLLIIAGGIIGAVLLFIYARRVEPVYTSKATVFPLNATNDNSAATSALTSMLGITETPKSFSQDASINIVELAQSRNTREAVALERIPALGNKTIARLLIENYNKSKESFQPAIKEPSDTNELAIIGGNLLKPDFSSKINKNGILEVNYSSKDVKLVSPITYVFIDKISEFYKELKIRKAKLDYDFTVKKIDSLDKVLDSFDHRAIHMANTTMFVASDKVEYQIPKENLANEKERVLRQRDASSNNREEALWRLQKQTPIISILDRPEPPFEINKPSAVLYAFIGFILGMILAAGITVSGIIYSYAKEEAKKAILGDETPVPSDTNPGVSA
ncbi:MAG: hypothetical protein JST81_08050 [Bacteroidetes bacterium]|nr:hypothetical protein [Bacteroidota bacterium]